MNFNGLLRSSLETSVECYQKEIILSLRFKDSWSKIVPRSRRLWLVYPKPLLTDPGSTIANCLARNNELASFFWHIKDVLVHGAINPLRSAILPAFETHPLS